MRDLALDNSHATQEQQYRHMYNSASNVFLKSGLLPSWEAEKSHSICKSFPPPVVERTVMAVNSTASVLHFTVFVNWII